MVATPNPPLQSLQSNLKQQGRRGRRRASACTTAKAKFAARPPNPGTCRATHFTNVSKSLRRMSRYRLWSIKSGPSKAFSNAQGSGARQRTVSVQTRSIMPRPKLPRIKRHVLRRYCRAIFVILRNSASMVFWLPKGVQLKRHHFAQAPIQRGKAKFYESAICLWRGLGCLSFGRF